MKREAMASTAAILSWGSSSWLHNRSLTKNMNESTKISNKGSLRHSGSKGSQKDSKVDQIILKEDVVDLGKKGQLLDGKAGFYRNFLLPMGKAQIVFPTLIK